MIILKVYRLIIYNIFERTPLKHPWRGFDHPFLVGFCTAAGFIVYDVQPFDSTILQPIGGISVRTKIILSCVSERLRTVISRDVIRTRR